MRIVAVLALLLSLTASAATTLAPGTYTVASCPSSPPVTPPPVTTPPPVSGAYYLFNNGVFTGAGDYSYGSGKVTYGIPPNGVVTVSGDEGWQPRMPNDNFDATGYNYVIVSIKPTQAGNTWISGMEMIGDVGFPGCPNAPSIMKYGPNPAIAGVWNTYKIPLSVYCVTPALHPYKIMFLEQSSSNKSGNSVQFNAVGFAP